jgi:hypothetical protein
MSGATKGTFESDPLMTGLPLSLRHVAARPSRLRGLIVGISILGALFALPASIVLAQGDEGTPEQREACTPDAMHLCNAYIPDAERVKECLAQHVGDLSAACREVFEKGQKSGPALAADPQHKNK